MIQLSLIYPELPIFLRNNKETTFLIKQNSDENTKIAMYLSYYDDNKKLQTWSFLQYFTIHNTTIDRMIFFVPKITKKGVYLLACYRQGWFYEKLFWTSPEFFIN